MKNKIKKFLICGLAGVCLTACSGVGTTKEVADTAETENTEVSDKQTETTENSDNSKESSRDIFAMDTYLTVTAYGEYGEEAVDAAEEEILRLDTLLSTGDEDSEIAKINLKHGGSLSKDTEYLIDRSQELYKSTDGAFDIAIYPVMEAWGFTTRDYRVPGQEELEELLKETDLSELQLDTEAHTVSMPENMEIDLGGIAKGYTSARLMDLYREHGVTSGMVNLGGNVQVLGTKPDGSLWRVAVQSPDEEWDYLGIVSIQDKAVITSGGYERYFEEDGVTYHHIIDPATGYPADSGLTSVTVVSVDGTLADGLSTSLFIMGAEKAEAYWRDHTEEFDMILLTDGKELLVTEGLEDSFETDLPVTMIRQK